MAQVEIALGLITAGSALYGFVIAYYVFARLLHNQEEWHVEYRFHDWEITSEEYTIDAQQKIRNRRIKLNIFLQAASVAFASSLAVNTGSVFFEHAAVLAAGVVSFFALVIIVLLALIKTSRENLRETKREVRLSERRLDELEQRRTFPSWTFGSHGRVKLNPDTFLKGEKRAKSK